MDSLGAHLPARCRRSRIAGAVLAVLAVLLVVWAAPPAAAQGLPLGGALAPRPDAGGGDPQMLVQAAEINYDYNNERVSAVGNVQIYYNGATIEADKVVYDQRTKHLHAEGNVRLTEPDGKITHGEIIDLTDHAYPVDSQAYPC